MYISLPLEERNSIHSQKQSTTKRYLYIYIACLFCFSFYPYICLYITALGQFALLPVALAC